MKVNKEEMFGMYAALKSYIERDHKKEWQDWLDRISRIKSQLETIASVKGETNVSRTSKCFSQPASRLRSQKIKTTPKEVLDLLKNGTPILWLTVTIRC